MTKKYTTPTMSQLFEAGVHFGHQVRRWHPSMEPYIFTSKNNIHIIDLEQTENKLKEASDFLYETAKTGGQIIFIGTKKQSREVIMQARTSGSRSRSLSKTKNQRLACQGDRSPATGNRQKMIQ